MAQSATSLALDFCSGHDLTVCETEPRVGLCTDSTEPAWDSLSSSLSLSLSAPLLLMLSLSINLKKIKITKFLLLTCLVCPPLLFFFF